MTALMMGIHMNLVENSMLSVEFISFSGIGACAYKFPHHVNVLELKITSS